jgi:signal transduction histidine kinase
LLRRPWALGTLAVVFVALGLVGLLETVMGSIEPHDRLAYPMLAVWFAGLWLLLWRRPQLLDLAMGLAVLAGAVYFLITAQLLLLQPGRTLNLYSIASLLQWLPLMYLMIFLSWQSLAAALLAVALLLGVAAPALWLHLSGTGGAQWNEAIWPIVANGLLNQVCLLFALTGVVQLGRSAERARAAAESASQAKSRFLAVMSHELRTPLHAVLGATELLRRDLAVPPPASAAGRPAQLLDTIGRSGTHLLHLIEQVLDLSRIEAGRLIAHDAPFDLRQCADDALRAVASAAQAKGLDLRIEGELAAGTWRQGDALRLRQVLINLLANAVKFTEQGEVVLRISADSADGRCRFEVRDTGPGIAACDLDRVFEAFYQVDAGHTRQHQGAGLGLTISRELVRFLGGELLIDSAAGRGTRLWFELPLASAAAPTAATLSAAHDANAGAGDLAGLQVLLVDDDPVNQTLGEQMLASAGVRVTVVDSGAQALQSIERGGFNLVLMDWRMPGMDGLETTRRLRDGEAGSRASSLPVIGLTANAFEEDRQACLAAGMDDMLTKPVSRADLMRAVSRWAAR